MKINHNISALHTYRQLSANNHKLSESMEKLSSGLRINKAGDDAAGLSISEKMRAQIRGLEQASRNIQDGISLIQTAEGGLNEIHELVQRGRELSVQASNDTLNDADKASIQEEIEQIKEEVTNIAGRTNFNGIKLLDIDNDTSLTSSKTDEELMMETLKRSMLEQSEKMVKDYFGLQADGVDIKIIMKDYNDPNALAWVQYQVDPLTGKGINIEMHMDKQDFLPPEWPNGGSAPIYNDRIIAHEMTHAIMARSMNFAAMPKWFKEGAAELIHGGDERLAADISINGKQNVIDAIDDPIDSWDDPRSPMQSIHYSAGYVAVRYLHDRIKTAGGAEGIKELMTYLNSNPSSNLDTALKNISHGAYTNGLSDFITDFKTNGVNFIDTKMNLSNTDTGAIGGRDAEGITAEIKTATSVVADVDNYTEDPLSGFNEIWLDSSGNVMVSHNSDNGNSPSNGQHINIQVGAGSLSAFSFNLTNMKSDTLEIGNVNVIKDASGAISAFDQAILSVSSERGRFGAIQNRLEYALEVSNNINENLTSAESRIRDVDMAKEMMKQTKSSILSQVAQTMLAQANQQPQNVLQLLR
ncbi:flagellinolysin [Metabacillus litoralis]|uniref:flagellinolysin n=1 Tax=Metabacillus litoralis TaxID=152268 RepID=UPI0013CE70FA|nr:flagellinolysin [Metabacillus litoralis]